MSDVIRRDIGLVTITSDGMAVTEVWTATAEQAEALRAQLGEPGARTLAPLSLAFETAADPRMIGLGT